VLVPHSRQVGSTEIREFLDFWVTGEIACNINGFVIPLIGTGCDDWLLIMALTTVIITTINVVLKPEPMKSSIEIPVFLEILISCFLGSVEVCFIQWANQSGEPREMRILRCGAVRGIARLVEGMPIISSTGLKG
jgi:hypothetical protein